VTSACSPAVAKSNAVWPLDVRALTSALLASSTCTTLRSPLWEANIKAVTPSDHIREHHNIRCLPYCGCYRTRLTLPEPHGYLEEAQMTFQSISSLTNQRELATLGMFACSFATLPVASLPSESLLPLVIENRSDRGFPQPKPHGVLSCSPERNAAAIPARFLPARLSAPDSYSLVARAGE